MSENEKPAKKYERERSKKLARTDVQTPWRLLTQTDVVALVNLGSTTIDRMVKQHKFPQPVQIDPDSKRGDKRWRLKDVEDWVKRLETQDDKLPAA